MPRTRRGCASDESRSAAWRGAVSSSSFLVVRAFRPAATPFEQFQKRETGGEKLPSSELLRPSLDVESLQRLKLVAAVGRLLARFKYVGRGNVSPHNRLH